MMAILRRMHGGWRAPFRAGCASNGLRSERAVALRRPKQAGAATAIVHGDPTPRLGGFALLFAFELR
jgi:hypothetical protein